MTSYICSLDGSADSITKALEGTEHFASGCGLSPKQQMHLRLLAEELIGMAGSVLEVKEGSFRLEQEGLSYKLHLTARVETGKAARKLLLGVSSSGENQFYKGVTGKIRQAVDFLSQGNMDCISAPSGVSAGLLPSQAEVEWSLTRYKESLRQETQAANWDELEKSVLSKLADDILVGVRVDEIAITILKLFS